MIKNVYVNRVAGLLLLGLSLSSTLSAADVVSLIESCSTCHGKGGVSTHDDVPTIAGYSEDYFSQSLEMYLRRERPCVETEYRVGRRKGLKTDMCKIVQGMREKDIEMMGQYFSRQKFVRTPQKYDAELAKKGEAIHMSRCDECHSDAGTLPSDNAGILGGQKMSYLREQIRFVRDGQRYTSRKMRLLLEALDEEELEAVVNYYGSF